MGGILRLKGEVCQKIFHEKMNGMNGGQHVCGDNILPNNTYTSRMPIDEKVALNRKDFKFSPVELGKATTEYCIKDSIEDFPIIIE